MLQTGPQNRYEFHDLCTELEILVGTAKRSASKVAVGARPIEDTVIGALTEIENIVERGSSLNLNALPLIQQPQVSDNISEIEENETDRIPQAFFQGIFNLNNIPSGQTSYCREVLEEDLKRNSIIQDDHAHAEGMHNGPITESLASSPNLNLFTTFDKWKIFYKSASHSSQTCGSTPHI